MVRTGILSLRPVYFYPLSTAVGVIFECIESINPVHLTETWKSKKKKKIQPFHYSSEARDLENLENEQKKHTTCTSHPIVLIFCPVSDVA